MKDLNEKELNEIDGGFPIISFVAGALIGGAIYDVYKYACHKVQEGYENGTITNVGSKR